MSYLWIDILITIQVEVSCKWTNDSQRFLLEHLDTIHESPSHIYHSALPFAPPTTWLQKYYGSEVSSEVKVIKGLSDGWGVCSRTVPLGTEVYEITYSNNTVAIGSGCKDIIILDAITGSQIAILSEHQGEVNSITFSSDGRSLVSGSDDKTVKLWDMQTGGAIKTFSGHTELVRSVSISEDCTTIASGSFDKTVRLWDAQTGGCHHIIRQQQAQVYTIKFSPMNPQYFLYMSNHKVLQLDIRGQRAGPKFEGTCANFSPDGTQIVSCYKKIATVQNSSSGAVISTFPLVLDSGQHCCFSLDGRMIAVAAGNTTYVWDITSSESHPIETFIGHTNDISSLVFSSPSSLISASIDKSIRFWRIGAEPATLVGTDPESLSLAPATIISITLQAKDGIYITSDSDGVVRTCDIFTGLCKASFQTPAKGYNKRDIQLSKGRLILAWYTDVDIEIWDIEKGRCLYTVNGPRNFEDIKISEDGSKFFSVGSKVIQVQSIKDGEVLGKAEIAFIDTSTASLTVHGSSVWIHYPNAETQVWTFRGSLKPAQPPNMPLHILHPKGTVLWDADLSCVKEKATGKVVFQLPNKYGKPVNMQWNDLYLVASFRSGEVLVLDFSHVLPL